LTKDCVFAAGSNLLTNRFMPMMQGDRLSYAGSESYEGYGRYLQAVGSDVVEGVSCLKVRIKGHGNEADPELDPELSVTLGRRVFSGMRVRCGKKLPRLTRNG